MTPRLEQAALALDATKKEALAAHALSYAGTDLICYRAADDASLARVQAQAWDPWLEWLQRTYGARLYSTSGIMPISQSEEALLRLRRHIAALSNERLVVLHELTTTLGSLVLALAVTEGALPAAEAFELSVMDESHQERRWGVDEEAQAKRASKREDAVAAGLFVEALFKGGQ